jgi:hypothetical protein
VRTSADAGCQVVHSRRTASYAIKVFGVGVDRCGGGGTQRHEVVHVKQSQDPSSRDRNELPGGIGESLRVTKFDRLPACLDLAASRREYVADPVAVRAALCGISPGFRQATASA